MKKLIVLSALGLAACTAPAANVPPVSTVPASVQSACNTVTWAVPLIRVMAAGLQLNPNESAMLSEAIQAQADCAAGNAPATIADIANGLVAILYPAAPVAQPQSLLSR